MMKTIMFIPNYPFEKMHLLIKSKIYFEKRLRNTPSDTLYYVILKIFNLCSRREIGWTEVSTTSQKNTITANISKNKQNLGENSWVLWPDQLHILWYIKKLFSWFSSNLCLSVTLRVSQSERKCSSKISSNAIHKIYSVLFSLVSDLDLPVDRFVF